MNKERILKQICFAIKQKKSVNSIDILALSLLGIPAKTYIEKCNSLDAFLASVYTCWHAIKDK